MDLESALHISTSFILSSVKLPQINKTWYTCINTQHLYLYFRTVNKHQETWYIIYQSTTCFISDSSMNVQPLLTLNISQYGQMIINAIILNSVLLFCLALFWQRPPETTLWDFPNKLNFHKFRLLNVAAIVTIDTIFQFFATPLLVPQSLDFAVTIITDLQSALYCVIIGFLQKFG
jgi:hypothetical protein